MQFKMVSLKEQEKLEKKEKSLQKWLEKKYSNTIPLHMLLKKAHKFKKYNLSDAEFAEFKRSL